jgi:selenocysteine lyase/cysteine desulfurase
VWARGEARAPDYDAWVERSRSAFARLVGVDATWVATGSQVSGFTGVIAAALPPGAEVVAYEGEFTSVLFPFLARGDLSVRLVGLDAIAGAVGPDTALVAVSAVQSADGRVADLPGIARAAEAAGAWSYVDATQAVGWLPFDAAAFDLVSCGAYKWLLSPRGSAFLSVRPERLDDLPALAAGWYAGEDRWTSIYGAPLRLARDARRLDLSPAWLSWVGTAVALEALAELDPRAIHAHATGLAERLRSGLGLPPDGRSAIVSVDSPGAAQRLASAGIRAAVRDGRVRLGFHLYNTDDDVALALEALARQPAGPGREAGAATRP